MMSEYYSGLCGELINIFWNRLSINLKFIDGCVSNEDGLGILSVGVEVSWGSLCSTT
jgi:hypothetical protein